MTTVHLDLDEFKLEVTGHAGEAEPGQDLTCAGASILAITLLNAAKDREDYHADVYMDWKDAAILVQCDPDESAEADCREMFRVIMHGYAVLKQRRPGNIRICIEGD